MLGGGYVLGGEVARALVELNKRMSLKFTPVEDATVGFWLMSMDIRHINHPKFRTKALVCCVHALPVRCAALRPGARPRSGAGAPRRRRALPLGGAGARRRRCGGARLRGLAKRKQGHSAAARPSPGRARPRAARAI